MKSQEILQSISPALVEEIFSSLHSLDRASYRTLVETLATRKKLRAVFLERKPRTERHLWMRDELSRNSNQDLSDQVIQVWLLATSRPMICAFLDKLGITHDGQGMVDTIPAQPDGERLRKAVKELLETYPPSNVAVYLNYFAEMDEGEWPELNRLLTEEEGLRLQAQPAIS